MIVYLDHIILAGTNLVISKIYTHALNRGGRGVSSPADRRQATQSGRKQFLAEPEIMNSMDPREIVKNWLAAF